MLAADIAHSQDLVMTSSRLHLRTRTYKPHRPPQVRKPLANRFSDAGQARGFALDPFLPCRYHRLRINFFGH